MKPCPFCGMEVDLDEPDTLYPSGSFWRTSPEGIQYYVRFKDSLPGDNPVYTMHCPETTGGCGVEISGDTKDECMIKWNRRINHGDKNTKNNLRNN